jgi:methylmalonyl-CoA mutase N-terminal domain/subunit
MRGAYGLLANVLGGVQGMLHPALDEPFAIPTEETAKLALRTQQICAYETGVTKVADPLGGSYYVEAMTDQLEQEIEKTIQVIDRMGGAVPAIEKGYMQQSIADEAYRVAMEEKSGKRVVVGVNRFQGEPSTRRMQYHRFDPLMFQRQVERTRQVRKERDDDAVARALDRLRQEAAGSENLLPCLVDTAKTYATLGEIMGTLKEVFGAFKEPLLV